MTNCVRVDVKISQNNKFSNKCKLNYSHLTVCRRRLLPDDHELGQTCVMYMNHDTNHAITIFFTTSDKYFECFLRVALIGRKDNDFGDKLTWKFTLSDFTVFFNGV